MKTEANLVDANGRAIVEGSRVRCCGVECVVRLAFWVDPRGKVRKRLAISRGVWLTPDTAPLCEVITSK
jgi:hypothetical protein